MILFSQETQLVACIRINAMNAAGLEFQRKVVKLEGVVLTAAFLQ